jgi:hypothetical protein
MAINPEFERIPEDPEIDDGYLIIGAIDGLLEELDFNQALAASSTEFHDGLSFDFSLGKDGSCLVRIGKGGEHLALYSRNEWRDEVYELAGTIPISESKAGIRVIVEAQRPRKAFYYLRGESVSDEHRVGVVRRFFGFKKEWI